MPELIDKHAAYTALKHEEETHGLSFSAEAFGKAARIIDQMPTIEPEVRHGRWIESQTDLICSVCKWKYNDELPFMSNNGLDSMTEAFAHCPHCGARLE